MSMMDEKARLEYAALMSQVRDAERMTFSSWLAAGIASAALLAWGTSAHSPGFMVPVVLVAAAGYLAMARARERAMMLAGYLEAHHESESEQAAYFTRAARLQATSGGGNPRDWHATTYFNVIAVAAAVFAWMSSESANHGELWAGVVTGCALAFASYSVSETARMQHVDAAAMWRRADGRLEEVSRRMAR
jgi:hypothetical protein